MACTRFSWQSKRGLKIHAQDWQPQSPARGAVALVHGLGEHIGRYDHVAQTLNKAGYALTGFDLPGHGQTTGTRGHSSFDDIGDEIDHLLEEVAQRYPDQPRFLYGHSLGGALVLYYALKRRPALQGVIATSPGLGTGAAVPPFKLFLARVLSRLSPSFTMDNGLDLDNLCRDQAVIQLYRSDPLVHKRVSTRLGWDILTLGGWMVAHAAEFPLPLLLAQGSADHIVSPAATAAFARAVPPKQLTYKVWEGCYHETHNEPEKEQVLQTMLAWLGSRSGPFNR